MTCHRCRRWRGASVVDLQRSRYLNDELDAWWTSTLTAHLVPGLTSHLGDSASLYATLTNDYGLRPTRQWTRLEFPLAPRHIAEKLDLRGRPRMVLLTGLIASQPDGPPLELTQAWLRDDLFDMVMELGQPPTGSPRWLH